MGYGNICYNIRSTLETTDHDRQVSYLFIYLFFFAPFVKLNSNQNLGYLGQIQK